MPLELKPGTPDAAADQPFGVVGVAAAQRVDEKLMFVMDAVASLSEGDVTECTRGRMTRHIAGSSFQSRPHRFVT